MEVLEWMKIINLLGRMELHQQAEAGHWKTSKDKREPYNDHALHPPEWIKISGPLETSW